MKIAKAALIVLALALGGCATMSKDECLTVDWRTVGYEDGVAGRSGDRIGSYRKACADHGVRPDLDAYQAGREEGLREYCQPENGFRVGSSGGSYGGACPAELAPRFAVAYESGRQLYVRERRVDSATSQLYSKRQEMERIEHALANRGFVVVDPDTTSEQRAQALLDTKQLAERYGRLEAEVEQLEKDKLEYERELEEYRTQVAYAP
jgi:hypothetical protein